MNRAQFEHIGFLLRSCHNCQNVGRQSATSRIIDPPTQEITAKCPTTTVMTKWLVALTAISISQEIFTLIFTRPYIVIALALVAGCATPGSMLNEQESPPQDVAEVPAEAAPETVVEEKPVPDACEILLARLDETQPLLNSLDESLAGQADRIERAIERINRPVVVPQVQDCPTVSVDTLGTKEIVGAIEWFYMDPPGRQYRARIDSGAETSSLSASDVVEFERDGDDWVRFTFQHDQTDDPIHFELPIARAVLIRQASSVNLERRVVIELDIRLGQRMQTTEFTLIDRSHMSYPVLLGRAFLMDLYVVDVSRSYTHKRSEAR